MKKEGKTSKNETYKTINASTLKNTVKNEDVVNVRHPASQHVKHHVL